MSQFISNFLTYNINTEGEIARILSHFDSEYIFDIIRDNLNQRSNYTAISAPNIVSSFEQNFKLIKDQYQTDIDQIERVRVQTYKEIIDIICKEYNLQFNETDDNLDYYSAAYYLYDFLVANFSNYLVFFFANYIFRERNSIYEAFGLADLKKNKDNSTVYGKKIYKDIKFAMITANVDFIIDNICNYDISLYTILETVYPDKNIINYINYLISPIDDFYRNHYVRILNGDEKSIYLSNIKIKLHEILMPYTQAIINNKEEEI